MNSFDVEFQFYDLEIWFRVNNVECEHEDEAPDLAIVKLKNTSGIDVVQFAKERNTSFAVEIPYAQYTVDEI